MSIKVVIGIPLYQKSDLHPITQQCIQAIFNYNNQPGQSYYFEERECTGTSSFFSRNFLASKGSNKIKQKLDYDYYLSIDGDMGFTINNIIRLIKKYEEIKSSGRAIGILGAAYPGRGLENSNKLIAGNFSKVLGHNPLELYLPYDAIECIEVDYVGTGFMLIPKDVFESLEYPWFRSYVINVGDENSLTTEDLSICMDVKEKLERTIWCDCSNRVAHLFH